MYSLVVLAMKNGRSGAISPTAPVQANPSSGRSTRTTTPWMSRDRAAASSVARSRDSTLESPARRVPACAFRPRPGGGRPERVQHRERLVDPRDRGPRRVFARADGEQPEGPIPAVRRVAEDLGPDGRVLLGPATCLRSCREQQRATGLGAEVAAEEQPEHEAVPRRRRLDRLGEELAESGEPRAGDLVPRRARPRGPAPGDVALALERSERRVDLAEALAPEVPEHVADRLADRVAGHRLHAERPQDGGLRLTFSCHGVPPGSYLEDITSSNNTVNRRAHNAAMDGGPSVPGSPRPDRHRVEGVTEAPLRLADLLASLSLVADLGFGLPPEQAMRSCLVATALARRLRPHRCRGRPRSSTRRCSSTSGAPASPTRPASRYGDEMVVNAAAARTNIDDPRDVIGPSAGGDPRPGTARAGHGPC